MASTADNAPSKADRHAEDAELVPLRLEPFGWKRFRQPEDFHRPRGAASSFTSGNIQLRDRRKGTDPIALLVDFGE
jgi:hypothetical protein